MVKNFKIQSYHIYIHSHIQESISRIRGPACRIPFGQLWLLKEVDQVDQICIPQ